MKNISEINRNLEAINQTRHITNAMYLLSVSTMRKGLTQIGYNNRYMKRLSNCIRDILMDSPDVRSSFIDGDGYLGKRDAAFLVIASDKSLCGAYNINVANAVLEKKHAIEQEGREVLIYTAGGKIEELLRLRSVDVYKNFDGASAFPTMHYAFQIAEELIDIYKCGYVKDVYVVFTDYVSAAQQPVRIQRLLPLAVENFDLDSESHSHSFMTYEPSVEAAYNEIVSQYMQGYIYSCLCNALVCENMARMTAMQSATRNADEMLKKLSAAYNDARQLAITSELTEIAAATELIQNAI